MAKNKNDYFKLIEEQMSFPVAAADLLQEIFANATNENIDVYRTQIHKIEHQADTVHHDILGRLSTEFITPIDQEDILRLVQLIDDITDALDETVIDMYKYCVAKMPSSAADFCGHVIACVKALDNAIKELKNFKKPELLRKLLIEVNTEESTADVAYNTIIHQLFMEEENAKVLFAQKEVFDSLEKCCDLCEDAADIIEQIIMRNT
ncbi:MAG: DUF47 family protein [Clostridia bacterium]|nr:DUF47 family protein [Clostridia bacterium]